MSQQGGTSRFASFEPGTAVDVTLAPGFARYATRAEGVMRGHVFTRAGADTWVLAEDGQLWRLGPGNTTHVEAAPSAAMPSTVVRTYSGKQQAATAAFQGEATVFARHGYVVTSQSWAPGSWGAGAWLLALLLFLVLLGVLIFLYMLIVKPDGTLTVTYTREARAPTPSASPAVTTAAADRLSQLANLRDQGLITSEEYEAKRAEIVAEL
jgi:hypothetical protein